MSGASAILFQCCCGQLGQVGSCGDIGCTPVTVVVQYRNLDFSGLVGGGWSVDIEDWGFDASFDKDGPVSPSCSRSIDDTSETTYGTATFDNGVDSPTVLDIESVADVGVTEPTTWVGCVEAAGSAWWEVSLNLVCDSYSGSAPGQIAPTVRAKFRQPVMASHTFAPTGVYDYVVGSFGSSVASAVLTNIGTVTLI